MTTAYGRVKGFKFIRHATWLRAGRNERKMTLTSSGSAMFLKKYLYSPPHPYRCFSLLKYCKHSDHAVVIASEGVL